MDVDVLIMGGGIAGLWTLARLRRAGYRCLLIERLGLGAGQTIASQGIIHGGVKYALGSGAATDASKAIAQMPGVWRACLEGRGEIDLRRARVLSEHQYLWTAPGLSGMLGGLGASLAMRADCRSVEAERRPTVLREAPRSVSVYEVDEPVLDSRSVVEAIAEEHGAWCVRPRGIKRVGCARRDDGTVESVIVHGAGGMGEGFIQPKAIVCAAGEGNDALRSITGAGGQGLAPVKPQLRPLHMVMMRGAPGPMFAHCVGASTLPKLTITSAADAGGGWVWYVGGSIAEPDGGGVDRDERSQIQATMRLMKELLGWVDLDGCQLATCRWNRAEGVPREQAGSKRPEGPTVSRVEGGNVVYAWPTKLAFAPLLAERVAEHVAAMGISPSGTGDGPMELPEVFERAPVAPRPWEGRMVVSEDGFPTIQEVTWTSARSATPD